MIKEWWNKHQYKWHQPQYSKVYNRFMIGVYCCIGLLIATVVWSNLTGGIIIGSLKDAVIRTIMLFSLLVITVSVTISGTLAVIDGYEKKLSCRKASPSN